MNVSRSAVAKWETDKGLPDVNNLNVMAQLLNVSVDYLLDEYEKTGKCRDKKDAVCLAKNEDATAIYALVRNKKLFIL